MNGPALEEGQIRAIVVFVDMRGFSTWSQKIEAYQSTRELIRDFHSMIGQWNSKGWQSKLLGDGAMLVRRSLSKTASDIGRELKEIVKDIGVVDKRFSKLVRQIDTVSGINSALTLGWGITRGVVLALQIDGRLDFLGHQVNTAARLCAMAHPFGIVVDRDDFPEYPSATTRPFFPQVRRMAKPNQDVSVWVTAEIFSEFQARETLRETPEVHVAGVCLRNLAAAPEIFLAQRSYERRLFAGKWEGCGGQLRNSERFSEGVARHYLTEMKLAVRVVPDVPPEPYEINARAESLIPGLRFLCDYESGEPQSPNHIAYKWLSIEIFYQLPEDDFPPNFQAQARTLLDRCLSRGATTV